MRSDGMKRVPTSIDGFDALSYGGLPKKRATLVSGTSGSGKTVFACQFLAGGIGRSEPGVFVTFEETPADIRRNVSAFGWDIEAWEREGMWAFVDAAPAGGVETHVAGSYDLGGLLSRIRHAVETTNAQRVALDSIGAVFTQFTDPTLVRSEMFHIVNQLKQLGTTAVITAERTSEYGEIARFGIEEFVADNVVILRNALEEEKRRRTIEILKFRGAPHRIGEFPFAIRTDRGMVAMPIARFTPDQSISGTRITTGSEQLDEMTGGGIYSDAITLVSGATGTGKTLTATHWLAGGIEKGERCLLFALEESHDQFFRNAIGWGMDLTAMEKDGRLLVEHDYPEAANLEDHLLSMMETISEFRPNRIAVDSLSAFERVATRKSFGEFLIGLTSFLKANGVAALFTSTTPTLMGGTSVTEAHISTLTDTIVMLRYVEIYGEMRRGLAVLKMRGSQHEHAIREYTIDGEGMHIGKPFRNIGGILTGHPMNIPPHAQELERVAELFEPGAGNSS